jgi:8-oxo-dGTP diphosphatase
VGVGAVVICAGQVILVRRKKAPLQGQWSIPGGVVELGEAMAAAAVREVREETGVPVSVVTALTPTERIERDAAGRVRYHYVLVDFLCTVADAGPGLPAVTAASDASEAVWAPLQELRGSQQFRLADWTLDVMDEAVRKAREFSDIFHE